MIGTVVTIKEIDGYKHLKNLKLVITGQPDEGHITAVVVAITRGFTLQSRVHYGNELIGAEYTLSAYILIPATL